MIYGGDNSDGIRDILKADDGGYYILSSSYSGISGNKTAPNYSQWNSYSDFWLIKTDSLFNNEWQKSFGGNSWDSPYRILKDDVDNLYLIGYTESDSSGNQTVGTFGDDDADGWIIKTDANGNELWQKKFGGELIDVIRDAIIVNSRIYCIASSNSGISGVKTDTCRGGYDYWLFSIDTAGNMLWDKTFGGTANDYPNAIVTSNDVLYINGISSSSASGEKSEDNLGNTNVWLLKVDTETGALLGDKTFGSDGYDTGNSNSIIVENGFIYCSGASDGDITEYKSDTARNSTDYYLVKLDTALNYIWDKTLGGLDTEYYCCIYYANETLLLSGSSESGIGFEKTEDTYYNNDFETRSAWYLGLDTDGNILWDKTIGTNWFDSPANCFVENNELVFSINTSADYSSGDLLASPYGEGDIWLFKMSVPWTNISSYTLQTIDVYPNPVKTQLHVAQTFKSDVDYRITSMHGLVLESNRLNASESMIDVSILPVGVYILQIRDSQTVYQTKFTKF
jgi:hypothetical protein